jgi:hypothetical protein
MIIIHYIKDFNMPTYSYVSFPASNVKSGMDNVLHTAANYVVKKFSHRVIRGTFVDTRDKMRNIYMACTPILEETRIKHSPRMCRKSEN